MPPRRSETGYRGVRRRPNKTFSTEIRSDDTRVPPRTFQSAYAAGRAYETAAWRLCRSRPTLNFQDCHSV